MPYVSKELQGDLTRYPGYASTPGELNFVISKAVDTYLRNKIRHGSKITYCLMNEVVGALQLAQDEFKRRFVYPYEDRKIQENGDVYTFHLEEKK